MSSDEGQGCTHCTTDPVVDATSVVNSKVSLYAQLCLPENLLRAWESVRAKGSSGGIDGVSIETFEVSREKNIDELAKELTCGTFVPLPYRVVQIPKDDNEFRSISLPSINDKVVQTAVRDLIEPILEKNFLDVSYAYRRNKGAAKAIAYVVHMLGNEKRDWLTNCDIDKYFDNVDHAILFTILSDRIRDEKLVQLIRLWVRMGKVDAKMVWHDNRVGIPQGGVISPLLSNLYLHPLDVFMVEHDYGYVRYSDDFIVLSRSEGEARAALRDVAQFIEKKLKLSLNPDFVVKHVDEGFDFLGIRFKGSELSISDEKRESLKEKISVAIREDGMATIDHYCETVHGIGQYYGKVLPQRYLEDLDEHSVDKLKEQARMAYHTGNCSSRQALTERLKDIEFLSERSLLQRKKIVRDIIAFSIRREQGQAHEGNKQGAEKCDPIKKRKREYQKIESDGFELVVTTPGVFLGKTKRGIAVKNRGRLLHQADVNNLKHIFVMATGVSLSDNVIRWCASNKVPIDFVGHDGIPYARIAMPDECNANLQLAQLEALRNATGQQLARHIVNAKIRNQINLLKYYHKYRKDHDADFTASFDPKVETMVILADEAKVVAACDSEELRGRLFSIEGRAAAQYWDMVKILIDGMIVFEGREHKGATDIVNSLLNYGYGILYSKIWGAVTRAGLSPYISYLHKPQTGKPTMIFDLIEEFRSQAVDRAIFSMINKGIQCSADENGLTPETRQRVATEVLERINTIEDFRGKEMRLADIINDQAKAVASFLIGEMPRYLPYIGKW